MRRLRRFHRDDDGQDLVEYSLLLAFVVFAAAAVFAGMEPSASTIWGVMHSRLIGANEAAS